MLLSKTVASYEKQLQELIKKDPSNIVIIKNLLKEAVTVCQNESKTLRYLRLWLYLATLYHQPLLVCRHLLENKIGIFHALLYQDMAYYYMNEKRKDLAENILRQGIHQNAQPLEHLQQSLMDLDNDDRHAEPPSVKNSLPKETDETKLPLFMLGLGSKLYPGVLNAMELFTRQMARISLFQESEYYGFSPDEMRAEALMMMVEDVASPVLLSLDPGGDASLRNEPSRDAGSSHSAGRHQGKMPDPTYYPSTSDEQQQVDPDTADTNTTTTTILFPFENGYKRSLLQPHLPLDATHHLSQRDNIEVLNHLQRYTNVSLILDQETVSIRKLLGEGGYGKVFLATWQSKTVAIKICHPPDQWDHYIHQLIFQQCAPADAARFFIRSHALYLDHQASFMIMEYASQGTLLDCLNIFIEHEHMAVPEPLVQLLVLRLLQAILILHQVHVTHNDLKLDNLMMCFTAPTSLPLSSSSSSSSSSHEHALLDQISVKVIDFSLSVHLNLVAISSSSNVMMKWKKSSDKYPKMPAIVSDLPWPPFHLDYWGIANCAHMLLFATPMVRATHEKLKRYWNKQLWQRFFDILVAHPPAATMGDGLAAIQSLIDDLILSLADKKVNDSALDCLRNYDRRYKPVH